MAGPIEIKPAQESQTMKRFIAKLLFVVIIATLPANAVRAQKQTAPETLIRNATVLTITRGTMQNTDVLLRNGKIAAVGKNLNASAKRAHHRRHRQVRHARHHRLPFTFDARHH
jgi:hypothetical protein